MYSIIPIFASEDPTEGGLYAIHQRGDDLNCFDLLITRLRGLDDESQTWLIEMINKNWQNLKAYPYYFNSKIEVVKAIQKETEHLFTSIKELSIKGWASDTANLLVVFKPLDESKKFDIVELRFNSQAYKSKTPKIKHPLIRLYALRVESHPNLFVVVGGGIKATAIAQHTKSLGPELFRINEVAKAMLEANVTISWFNNTAFRL